MKRVLAGVNFQELDVQTTARRTLFGAILLEVNGAEKVERLAGKLRQVLGTSASIGRPTCKSQILIIHSRMDRSQRCTTGALVC